MNGDYNTTGSIGSDSRGQCNFEPSNVDRRDCFNRDNINNVSVALVDLSIFVDKYQNSSNHDVQSLVTKVKRLLSKIAAIYLLSLKDQQETLK